MSFVLFLQSVSSRQRCLLSYCGLQFDIFRLFVVLGIQFNKDPEMISIIDKASANGELFKFYALTLLIVLLVIAVLIGLFLLFYYLIYGILLKRLNKNYRELKKLEV